MKILSQLIILFILFPLLVRAQYQVIILKKDRVIKRYTVGDNIHYSTSGRKNFVQQTIVELTGNTIITTLDTIPYHEIKLVNLNASEQNGITVRDVGYKMIVAGIALPIADHVNVALVQDRPYSFSQGIGVASGALIGTGFLLLAIKKPYIKIRMNYRLIIVNNSSPLYR